MHIILRTSPYESQHKPPFGYERRKSEMCSVCWKSFVGQIDFEEDKLTIINDGWTTKEFGEIYHAPKMEIVEGDCGNLETFYQQLSLKKLDKTVLLLEDDYLWRPNTLNPLKKAVLELGFVSPYDHPGHHTEERFDKNKLTVMVGGFTYHKVPSNTLTFACTSKLLDEYMHIMLANGIMDHEMWTQIGGLFAPNASFATHMVDGLLAPNFNWSEYL